MQETEPKRVDLLALPEEAMAEWRQHPVTALLLRHLQAEISRAKDETAMQVFLGQSDRAPAYAGIAHAYMALLDDVSKPRVKPPEDTQDSTFVDPARRRVNGR